MAMWHPVHFISLRLLSISRAGPCTCSPRGVSIKFTYGCWSFARALLAIFGKRQQFSLQALIMYPPGCERTGIHTPGMCVRPSDVDAKSHHQFSVTKHAFKAT